VDIFTDENPCTGNEMEITINFVARGSFSDIWVNDDGSGFEAKGSFVDNLNKGELMVDRFRLRCIKP
jgi:hypothetical protein